VPIIRAVPFLTSMQCARARGWYGQIESGGTGSTAAIARHEGLAARYVSRLLRCAFLAPDNAQSLAQQPDTSSPDSAKDAKPPIQRLDVLTDSKLLTIPAGEPSRPICLNDRYGYFLHECSRGALYVHPNERDCHGASKGRRSTLLRLSVRGARSNAAPVHSAHDTSSSRSGNWHKRGQGGGRGQRPRSLFGL
jgi:hypothetical protein